MSHKSTFPGGSFHPRPHFNVLTIAGWLGLGLFKQRSTKKYLTRNLKSSSEVCEGHVILDSYVISFESKTSSAFEWEHQSWRQRWD